MSTKSFEAASNIQNAAYALISISACVDTAIHTYSDINYASGNNSCFSYDNTVNVLTTV